MSRIHAFAAMGCLTALAMYMPEPALACEQVNPCGEPSSLTERVMVIGAIAFAFIAYQCFSGWWNNVPAVGQIASDDPRMVRAKQKALFTIEEFWARYSDPTEGEEDFALKIDLQTEFGSESIWVGEISERKKQLFGRLLNEPMSDEHEFGQTIRFEREQICDWTYTRSGRLHGNFTAAVMLDQLPQRSKRQVLKDYGWDDSDIATRIA